MRYDIRVVVDQLGGECPDKFGWAIGHTATLAEAVAAVQSACIPGVRGEGAFAIYAPDGRVYYVLGGYQIAADELVA